MTVKEIIEVLEVAKAEIEWEYPIDYQEAFDQIIANLKEQLICPECGHILELKWEEETNEEILESSFYHCPKCLATYKYKRTLHRYFFG